MGKEILQEALGTLPQAVMQGFSLQSGIEKQKTAKEEAERERQKKAARDEINRRASIRIDEALTTGGDKGLKLLDDEKYIQLYKTDPTLHSKYTRAKLGIQSELKARDKANKELDEKQAENQQRIAYLKDSMSKDLVEKLDGLVQAYPQAFDEYKEVKDWLDSYTATQKNKQAEQRDITKFDISLRELSQSDAETVKGLTENLPAADKLSVLNTYKNVRKKLDDSKKEEQRQKKIDEYFDQLENAESDAEVRQIKANMAKDRKSLNLSTEDIKTISQLYKSETKKTEAAKVLGVNEAEVSKVMKNLDVLAFGGDAANDKDIARATDYLAVVYDDDKIYEMVEKYKEFTKEYANRRNTMLGRAVSDGDKGTTVMINGKPGWKKVEK